MTGQLLDGQQVQQAVDKALTSLEVRWPPVVTGGSRGKKAGSDKENG